LYGKSGEPVHIKIPYLKDLSDAILAIEKKHSVFARQVVGGQ
jgi:hypothetical protein